MMKTAARLFAVVVALVVSACAQYTAVPSQRVAVQRAFTVEPDMAWNRFNNEAVTSRGPVEIWTADGQLLNSVTFFAGVEDGTPLLQQAQPQNKLPAFRRDMSPTDIMELVEATVANVYKSPLVQSRGLRPARFGGADGFQFELSFVGQDQVDRQATAAGAVRGGRLYLILYQGARLYHYGLRQTNAQRIIDTVAFLEG